MAQKHVFILWLTELFHGCDGLCMTWTWIITWTNENTYIPGKENDGLAANSPKMPVIHLDSG